MNPALVQALQRLLVVGVVGALTAVGLNLTVLNGALGSSALLLLPILTAVIDAALKYLGGATVPATNVAAVGYKSSGIVWPRFWSV
jgi:hypothetical protein